MPGNGKDIVMISNLKQPLGLHGLHTQIPRCEG